MSYLPQTPASGGYLPYYLLLTSLASIYNAAQSYTSLWQSREVYSGKSAEMTPLAGRLFGTYTMLAAAIRLVAAYNITSPPAYNLAIASYLVAATHFGLEFFVYKGVKVNKASIPVFAFASVGITWTFSQRGYYLGL